MKGIYSLSDEELLSYADIHLQYEYDMLIWSSGALAFIAKKRNEGPLPWMLNNCLLNSFSLHSRNLINFLYSGSLNKDFSTDIILEDYLDDNSFISNLPSITPLLQEALIKANKQVAHLSMERIEYEESGKDWKFIDLTNEIFKSFSSISSFISSSKMSEKMQLKISHPGHKIPIFDISTQKLPSGFYNSLNLSIRYDNENKIITGISI